MTGPDDTTKPHGGQSGRNRGTRGEPRTIEARAIEGQTQDRPATVEPAAPTPGATEAPGIAGRTGVEDAAAQATPAAMSLETTPSDSKPSDGTAGGPGETAAADPVTPPDATTPEIAAAAEPAADRPAEPEPTPATSVPPVAPAPRPAKPSPVPAMAAGLVGGLIGAGLLAAALSMTSSYGEIGERLDRLEAGLGEKASRRVVEGLEKRVASAETASQGLRTDLDGLARRTTLPAPPSASGTAPTAVVPTNGPIAGAPVATAAPAAAPVPPLEDRALADRLARLDKAIAAIADRPPPAPPPPAPAIGARESGLTALSWLARDALARGEAVGRFVVALEQVKADPALLAALKPYADTPAPTGPTLAARLAPWIERLNKGSESGQSVTDKITGSLSRLYKVTPLGTPQGDSAGAMAARAETALQRGAFAAAAKELAGLPAPVPDDLAKLVAEIRRRSEAAQAADTLVARGVDQLITATQAAGATR